MLNVEPLIAESTTASEADEETVLGPSLGSTLCAATKDEEEEAEEEDEEGGVKESLLETEFNQLVRLERGF